MKPFILLGIFLFTSILSNSQSGNSIFYFDSEFVKSTKEGSVYTGIGEYTGGKLKLTVTYNVNGTVVLHGWFTDSTLSVRQGLVSTFDILGRKISEGEYVHNKEEGVWMNWNAGNLVDSTHFENGDAIASATYNYYKNGKPSSRTFKDNRTKAVGLTNWDEKGGLVTHAEWIKGTGEKTFYQEDGKIEKIEEYKNSKIVSTRYFGEDGEELSKSDLRKQQRKVDKEVENKSNENGRSTSAAPEFPGGSVAFSSYFTKNFKAPPVLFEQLRPVEKITVTFLLDKNGYATDIKIIDFSNMEVYEAVREVFNRMSPWNMKGLNRFGPVTYVLHLQRGY